MEHEHVHLHIHLEVPDWLRGYLDALIRVERRLIMTLDELKVKVEEETTVTQSAITLMNGLSQQLRDAAANPAKIKEIADAIDAQKTALAEAITANTPQG